nr:choice-of-anchor X domain-containing protein [Stigmatella aurantiaca]
MPPSDSVSGSRPRRAVWLLLLIPLVLGGAWWAWVPGEDGGGEPLDGSDMAGAEGRAGARRDPRASAGLNPKAAHPQAARPLGKPPRSPEEEEREAKRALWEKRLERARFTLDTYRQGTRYPPQSRPIREHPDQEQLPSPERAQPLSKDARDVQLRLKQEKVFVVGDELVHFYVGCENANTQEPLPCEVVGGMAHEAEHMVGAAGAPAGVPLVFGDDGSQGDVVARDGTFTARFQPSKQGFPMFSGTLRVSFQVRSGSQEGRAFFDILYTPVPPAVLTGKVREVVEQGSLQLYLGIQVRKAGRYVLTGRVDDEAGVPFGHVSFNEELAEGAHEVKFTLFGKLLVDEAPSFPLRLRDVDGFLLKESGDPDRELMAALRGYVHATREYPPTVFSPDEWQSEERTRYLDEFTRDVNDAQNQLDAVGGTGTP